MGVFSKLRMRAAPALLAVALAGCLAAVPDREAAAQDITVNVDEARLVPIGRPTAEVIIGNPSVADVAVQSGRLLVITGKSFGLTNLVALDAQGREILHRKVRVIADPSRTVRIYKGKDRQSYDCASRCEATLVPGDAETYFEPLAKEIRNKAGIAQQTLDGSQPVQ